ncbi:hypothetical protein RUM44_008015 [Polyplax serrata]|uniref:Arf-GAP domain-containing protein n=1 Tax=Polyplax serrata TaxID=468196 RepID=A0ABR1B7J5_POLSC
MADNSPSKSDIQAIFKKLRGIPTNKSCFDCNAKNPTWSSVTYGVFICIDCSAVHRSLGVHVTFVRSTQLDTNWTWPQLRQMQLGGNANAANFFRQHNCGTTDAQQKYTSRAAQLYKDKLKQAAVQAMKLHGTKFDLNDHKNRSSVSKSHQTEMLHLEAGSDKPEEEVKELDFFEEHSTATDNFEEALDKLNLNENRNPIKPVANLTTAQSLSNANLSKDNCNGGSPSVNLSNDQPAQTGETKSLIGGRKPLAKKHGIGAKRGGKLGAQRVNANFDEIQREAEIMDQMREKEAEEAKILAEKTAEEEQKQMASMRLAYKDISLQQKKEEEKLKQTNPQKAQQMERLGMGFSVKSGISHSALCDMQTIEQENTIKPSSGSKYNFDSDNTDDFFDDYNFSSCNFGMYRNENKTLDSFFPESGMGRDQFGCKDSKFDRDSGLKDFSSIKGWNSTTDAMSFSSSFDEKPAPKEYERSRRRDPPSSSSAMGYSSSTTCDDAQKKFGNAKAISSDQYFGDSSANNWERKANLSRFEGSSSISSADFFGDGSSSNARHSGLTSSISAPDLDDVKESVRQGVTKVAGKISSLANGVLSSIQDRYGY